VRVTQRFINYETHRISDGGILATIPLTLPPQVFETEALWVVLPQSLALEVAGLQLHFMGGLHAAEHATIGLMPLYVMCDRWDLGGVSTPGHPQVPQPVIFVYDGAPGGVGLSRKAYDLMENLLSSVFEGVRDCDCEEGCPACIQSPKCGSGNQPLDKKAALWILSHVLGRKDLAPPSENRAKKSSEKTKEFEMENNPKVTSVRSGPPAPEKTGPVVFDIETQFLAGEIPGGWNNLPGMKVACVVVYDVDQACYFTYGEEEVGECVKHLSASSLVIGFNSLKFDYGVLKGYTQAPLDLLPALDLMADIQKRTHCRLSLSHLAQKNLGADKSADGVQSVQWWREGKRSQVVEYCKMDVKLTHDLWKLGKEKGYVLFEHKQTGELVKCPVDW
jgi:DEAD/DEAH box helicase domain-containing protein